MRTWALWVFGTMVLSAVLKTMVIGLCDYPLEHERWSDMVDLLISLSFIIWGAIAIW